MKFVYLVATVAILFLGWCCYTIADELTYDSRVESKLWKIEVKLVNNAVETLYIKQPITPHFEVHANKRSYYLASVPRIDGPAHWRTIRYGVIQFKIIN